MAVIDEFVVALRFAPDEGSHQRFQGAVKQSGRTVDELKKHLDTTAKSLSGLSDYLGKIGGEPLRKYNDAAQRFKWSTEGLRTSFASFGVTAAGAVGGFVAAMERVAASGAQLGIASQRIGTSANDLKVLQGAAAAAGTSADTLTNQLLDITRRVRADPGVRGIVRDWIGADWETLQNKSRDGLLPLLRNLNQLYKQNKSTALQWAELMGVSKDVLELYATSPESFEKAIEASAKLRERIGVDQEQLAKDSREFQGSMARIGESIAGIFQRAFTESSGKLGAITQTIEGAIGTVLDFNKEVKGAATIEALGISAVGGGAALAAGGAIAGKLGIPGAAAAATGGATLAAGGAALGGGALAGYALQEHVPVIRQAVDKVAETVIDMLGFAKPRIEVSTHILERQAAALAAAGEAVPTPEEFRGPFGQLRDRILGAAEAAKEAGPTPEEVRGPFGRLRDAILGSAEEAKAAGPDPAEVRGPFGRLRDRLLGTAEAAHEAVPDPAEVRGFFGRLRDRILGPAPTPAAAPEPPAEPAEEGEGEGAAPEPGGRPGLLGRARKRLGFQHGGIVPANLHSGEMVLPQDLSRGISRIVRVMDQTMLRLGGGGDKGSRADAKLEDWLGGMGGVPKVQIDDMDGLISALKQAVKTAAIGVVPGATQVKMAAKAGAAARELEPGELTAGSAAQRRRAEVINERFKERIAALLPGRGTRQDPRGMEPIIRAAAEAEGVDPDIAMRVARSEGLAEFQSLVRAPGGGRETSYGAFQLFTGGGLGNEFQKETGLDPSDPQNEIATIVWAMKKVRETGWGPWAGAKKQGITGMMGVGERPATAARGESLVRELQSKVAATRRQPIQERLRQQLHAAAEKFGLTVDVVSGGQAAIGTGGPRTGSTRHDIGGAADIKLRDASGRVLDMRRPEDQALMGGFVEEAVAQGATGVGAGLGYMGASTLHVGGGRPAAWGGAPFIRTAHAKGLERQAAGDIWKPAPMELMPQPQREPGLGMDEIMQPVQTAALDGNGLVPGGALEKAGDKTVNFDVNHTINVYGGDGGDEVGRYAGAARRVYGDLQRDMAGALA
ncbi:MAG: hypothetical protein C5B60_02480 [Chloroflexi bacterium]|nr:MAG: hypothetical protein C5B60_02480 [Chloroflexota bacterium]